MKQIDFFLRSVLLIMAGGPACGQTSPPVGSISDNIEFALFDGGGALADRSLTDLDGKLVVVMYYIPT